MNRVAIARWIPRSIGARVAAVSLALLFAIQIASFAAIRASLGQHARAALPGQLRVGEQVVASLIERNAQTLRQGAEVLAADYGFRTAVLSNDAETIASALANHGARIGATETALLGTDFSLRASSGDVVDIAPLAARLAAQKLTKNGIAGEIAVFRGTPYQVVLVPMKAPVLVGWVMMGFPLDRRVADDLTAVSPGLELSVLVRGLGADRWQVALTGGGSDRAVALAAAAPGHVESESSAPDDDSPNAEPPPEQLLPEVKVGAAAFGYRAYWLAPQVIAVVSLSVDDAMRTPADLQIGLAAITLMSFVVFGVGSLVAAEFISAPLRDLSSAAERLGSGDYTTPMDGQRRADEIGQLAHAFERMRVSVGEKQAEILKLAYWDGLTGLPNRVQFREAVRLAIESAGSADGGAGQEIAAAGRSEVAIVMLDLDRFKHVNDILGYRVGDLLLQRVGERLTQQVVRQGDIVARLGGDEFAVLLRGGDLALARTVAERIGRAFDEPLLLEEHTVDMGAGIGIACWPQHAADAETLLMRAEVAMYEAKRKAQGPLAYDAAFDVGSTQTLSLLSELRRAVEQNEFRLYLQPKLGLASGRVHGAETLVRWLHPTRGLVAPVEFIPFAEQTGFIRALTLWVFEEAARQWLELRREGLSLTLSVNLSTRDLLDPELPQKFDALLQKHRVPAEGFCLEITESAIMDDPQRSLATLERLSALGFRLSIDDFGTGYSSLAYLKRLPVDELKIDRSFVMNMVEDLDDAKIVRSTIDLAHNLGLTVVAEGVENARVWDALHGLDCDEAQGYHMGKPMPASEFIGWSTAWTSRQRPRNTSWASLLH